MSDSSFLGSGWSFPPTFELGTYQLNMTHKEHNINQSIHLILNTAQGERSLMPQFGYPLHRYVFQTLDMSLQHQIIDAVKTMLLNHEPRISVNEVKLDVSEDRTTISIQIAYTIRTTNSRHNYVYPFILNEASNVMINQGGL